jgi:hypothetical protein
MVAGDRAQQARLEALGQARYIMVRFDVATPAEALAGGNVASILEASFDCKPAVQLAGRLESN